MPAKTLMFQGTSSHVGKSVLTAAFCRILRRRGIRVAPFKGMNMSNNAFVTESGGEIATAQAVQARACGIAPTVEMNPVLLKTMADDVSQVVVLGRPKGVVRAADFKGLREELLEVIRRSLEQLMAVYDFVLIEGAGSPAEVNLQETDLANMAVARMAQAPVILVADIERGGVFAQMIGTLELLKPEDRSRIVGFIINKFRGDPGMLESGITWLRERTGIPVLAVIPYVPDLRIPEEDSLGVAGKGTVLEPSLFSGSSDAQTVIQILRYPTISNFTDFGPLEQEPDVSVEYLTVAPANGRKPSLLILPGSKSTMADLAWVRQAGLDRHIHRCVEEGVEVAGICGGFQMLGRRITDPSHVESDVSAMDGLGFLPTDTLFLPTKVTQQVKGIHLESGERVAGYEIHCGRLQGMRRGEPIFRLTERAGSPVDERDGCRLPGGAVWGTYLHGIFDEPGFRRWFLGRWGIVPGKGEADPIDRWADIVQRHLWTLPL